ncbi:hypothetical protein AU381_14695 [Sinorhizobium glycinis]|uniref:Helicase n=1 Tax=Sinorhizobium glycinis TaxID=1472378 RepID=A0A178Y5Z1_9HYPH|nr:hypothetical protein AU381_14695 [Sinorhizobium glycinis]
MRTMVMRTYLTATFLVAVAMGLAPALDLSGGASFSGLGIGAATAGSKGGGVSGSSTGGGAQAGASAGATAGPGSGDIGKSHATSSGSGVAAGKGGGSPGNSAGGRVKAGAYAGPNSGASGNAGYQSGGKLAKSGGGAASSKGKGAPSVSIGALPGLVTGSLKGGGTPKGVRAGAIAGIAPATGAAPSIGLPFILLPLGNGLGDRGEYEQGVLGRPVTDPVTTGAISDDPGAAVSVCLQAITSAALPLGAVRVRAASAGPLVSQRRGERMAPLTVRIDYAGRGGIEVRRARVSCHLDPNGRVIGVI